ncbi:histidine phosphatase family protein [Gilvimarinus agarilyticus]|uniref:histidine phosphatase family protein n=1 Tax=Gilvimarinus sp. 2_MG-2023 TaxID=3062666 RepID=UPI001C0A099F|nr:histidine phosphatase family protein [Gilvimarinus sp. 2_MG-2023]MBU2886862.1 histidine phosphatase family protein [Gilvimarinus agarilyticus]MDO6571523.1 histidine phosphatase family protein [Gilvimarinus sp. 2_MG-2023]
MQIDLLRHGACNGGHIFRGSIDVPLSEQGWQQMSTGLQSLQGPWQSIISSPSIRCQNFARTVAEAHGCELTLDEQLREIHFGDWEGQPVEQVWREQESLCLAWSRAPDQVTPPNGEPYSAFKARVLTAIARLSDTYGASDKVLIVTHGGVIKSLLNVARGEAPADMMQLNIDYGFSASLCMNGPEFNRESVRIIAPEEESYVYRA